MDVSLRTSRITIPDALKASQALAASMASWRVVVAMALPPELGDLGGELEDESHEHDRDHRHELDQDVEAGAAGVLEGVADGVAGDGGLVGERALALDLALFVLERAAFDVL